MTSHTDVTDQQVQFYADLPAFEHFRDISDLKNYTELPRDWHIVIADIQGSTKAIERGRYKDVNNVGVASIIAVMNAVKPLSIPYVFGGDGASLCIPEAYVDKVKEALLATQQMAKQQFDLVLRVGVVPYTVVQQSQYQVLIGKYQATQHYEQAMFTGDGMAYAEKLVKSESDQRFLVGATDDQPVADFTGFECRWNKIPSPYGETLSILVSANGGSRQENHKLYLEVLDKVEHYFGEIQQCCPLHKQSMRVSSGYRTLANEIRIRTSFLPFMDKIKYSLKLPLINLIGRYFMATEKVTSDTRWGDYKDTLIKHTDYRKFDDMLRMVISGTAEQRKQLSDYLEAQMKQQRLTYGIHASPSAIITCMISDYSVNHVHFIDGSQGGYAMAAKQLKQQLAVL